MQNEVDKIYFKLYYIVQKMPRVIFWIDRKSYEPNYCRHIEVIYNTIENLRPYLINPPTLIKVKDNN